ncbi:hypothetical protein JAAARDRAFT_195428 [Jaapia argillacea MUCL 33604]|uniref:Uncharacterized protein n=1 Tax=Jaapia argillacea MUCL 33604 TaxID=933084 RepID=A0A067PWC6_9AGAM|nr:hypothetical protein JAAARDRAFT_195428 [Jaapia argillacea MUCL 33604]
MPRLQFNPNLIHCPDFASEVYAGSRAHFVNENTTEEEAIRHLQDIWRAGNDAEKILWQAQVDEDARDAAEQEHFAKEAEDHRLAALELEKDNTRKEEVKKNKAKYIPIPDRDVPDDAPVITSQYAMKRLEKGHYVGMWYFTNAGIDDALHHSTTVDNDAMVLQANTEGKNRWVPAASVRVAWDFVEDKDLAWEDFCQAVPRMIMAMEDADWPVERVDMTLLVYQGDQRKLWHQAMSSPQGGYNISKINDNVLRKAREAVYWDAR